ncbi:MAG: hypothetical protein FWF24_04980 [Alphaproteobacteria bacterium]|nr:hypothetical protein [Alphaproteobacteria bacterium]
MRRLQTAFLLFSLLFSFGHVACAEESSPVGLQASKKQESFGKVLDPSVPEVIEGAPLGVRFPSLPNPAMQAVPGDSVSHKRASPPAPARVRQPPKTHIHDKDEECHTPDEHTALEAYRRAELDEMESDRLTLQAMQEALEELSLTNRLDFMLNPAAGKLKVMPTDQEENNEKTTP